MAVNPLEYSSLSFLRPKIVTKRSIIVFSLLVENIPSKNMKPVAYVNVRKTSPCITSSWSSLFFEMPMTLFVLSATSRHTLHIFALSSSSCNHFTARPQNCSFLLFFSIQFLISVIHPPSVKWMYFSVAHRFYLFSKRKKSVCFFFISVSAVTSSFSSQQIIII